MIKLIVFDFDGTIVDTKEMIRRALKFSLSKHGYKITKKLLKILGDQPIEGILEKLISNFKHIEEISDNFILLKNKNFKQAKLIKEIKHLKKIKQRKIILSNNLSFFIKMVLRNLKINFFYRIYGAETFKNKEDKLKSIIKKYKLKPLEVIYIGDKPTDVALARKIGCISVAISHKASWSSKKDLKKAKPEFLISNLKDLNKIVHKLAG